MKVSFTSDIKRQKEFISSRRSLPEKAKGCPSGKMKMTLDICIYTNKGKAPEMVTM